LLDENCSGRFGALARKFVMRLFRTGKEFCPNTYSKPLSKGCPALTSWLKMAAASLTITAGAAKTTTKRATRMVENCISNK
jgi:hypothetical protein